MNIERRALVEMEEAENNGTFEYNPNLKPSSVPQSDTLLNRLIDEKEATPLFASAIPASNATVNAVKPVPAANELTANTTVKQPSPPLKRKSSLDEFELEIEGINLDDTLDTSVSFRRGEIF